MKNHKIMLQTGLSLLTALSLSILPGQASEPENAVARMPVKEVTIFKDGHAVINQEGEMPTNGAGDVILDRLPNPVMGTFFAYSADSDQKLVSVTAGQRKIKNARTALALAELIAANIGAQVKIDELSGSGTNSKIVSYDAQIMGIPTRSAEELARSVSSGTKPDLILPIKSNLVELKTLEGTSFVPVERIQTITFKGSHNALDSQEELRNVLTLKLGGADKSQTARVGMMYVENGLRWIPSYKVTIDGKNNATVKLQATIVNDLIDLEDVATNLVVGVPSFAFKDENDPISLSQTLSAVASRSDDRSYIRHSFSNAIMSQSAYARDEERPATVKADSKGSKNEDLFVFSVKHLTIKKGERIVLPVREYQVSYKDLYTLELPVLPPAELQYNGQQQNEEQEEQIKLAESLKVMHKIRLTNSSKEPLTTAPALIFSESNGKNEILAQGMMTYAAPGGSSDLTLTQAIDLKTKKDEREVSRQPDAVTWQDHKYARINMKGTIKLTNYGNKPASVEITRKLMGKAVACDKSGKIVPLSPMDQWKSGYLGYYNWPNWWLQVNSYFQFVFKQEIQPKESAEYDYEWHYFWHY